MVMVKVICKFMVVVAKFLRMTEISSVRSLTSLFYNVVSTTVLTWHLQFTEGAMLCNVMPDESSVSSLARHVRLLLLHSFGIPHVVTPSIVCLLWLWIFFLDCNHSEKENTMLQQAGISWVCCVIYSCGRSWGCGRHVDKNETNIFSSVVTSFSRNAIAAVLFHSRINRLYALELRSSS